MRDTPETYSLAKISRELGVSKASVSLALNGKARQGGLSLDLEQRILEFCRQVNYRPNIHAQRLNRRLVDNIGVLIEETGIDDELTPFADYNISHVIGGIAAAADAAGYRFSVQLYKRGMDEERIFEWFDTREIDGLIYYGFDMPDSWRSAFRKQNHHVVGVSINPDQDLPCVNVDNFQAAQHLATHLIAQGRRHFLYLAGNPSSYPGQERLRGFRNTLQTYQIPFADEFCFQADYSFAKAQAIIRRRMQPGQAPVDAIVCANDNMALGAISALQELDINVPEQVAVTGADNIKLGRFFTPPLTTFDYRPYDQGRAAFKLLQQIIQGEANPPNITLDAPAYLRDSA
jgi:DNA-binding LacI/PurR family transcriptional regulator